jgi:hypothetical protein
MANMLSRLVAVSVEVNTGSYNGPTSNPTFSNFSSGIHQFRNTSPASIDTNSVDLQELRQSFSQTADAIGRQLVKLTPGLVVMGAGTAANAYAATSGAGTFRLGRVLRMCGMSESAGVTGGSSSLTYTFRSTGFEDGLVECQYSDISTQAIRYRMKGVFGTFTMSGSAGQVITCDPTLTGLVVTGTPSLVTAVTPALPTNLAETMKSEGMTITGTALNGGSAYTPKFKSFQLDAALDIQEDPDANGADAIAGLVIAGRKPSLQIVIGADSARVSEFYTDLKNAAIHTVTWTHGTTAGRFCKFTVKGQLKNVTSQDDAGLRTLQLQYDMAIGSGADDSELTIQFS